MTDELISYEEIETLGFGMAERDPEAGEAI